MLRVFCDFDGTIAPVDVGNQMFRAFADGRAVEIVQQYLAGTINARQCLTAECAAVNNCSAEELARFVDQFSLDPHFAEFVRFCTARGIPLAVLSDGLDFYVERLLRREGLGHLPWYANRLEFKIENERTVWVPSFPYTDSECDRCAHCKRNTMVTQSAEEDVLVYVGNGFSDRCPVRYADIVFAKGELIPYCQEQNITYHPFRHFGDVRERMEVILQRKRIRHRREAAMARRELFMQG